MARKFTEKEKVMSSTKERQQAVELAMSQFERQFGKGAIMRLGSDASVNP